MITKYWQRVGILAFGHGLNDFTAGYMLGNLWYHQAGLPMAVAGFLIYNLLAFGGQYFAAMFLQKISARKMIVVAAAMANVIAVLLFYLLPQLSLVLAGLASAFYHVAGGGACLKENKAAPLGVFAAPGIIGLALAGYLSWLGTELWVELLLTCSGFVLLVQALNIPPVTIQTNSNKKEQHLIDQHDLLMILLLAIISLRSAVWNILQVIHDENYTWLLAIAASAFVGKIFGGWLSDRVGWKIYSLVSLLTAMPLLNFFKDELFLFCLGVGLLQSAIPANTSMMIAYCRGQQEKGIALSLGVAVAAGVVFVAPIKLFSTNDLMIWLLFSVVAISILLFRRKKTLLHT